MNRHFDAIGVSGERFVNRIVNDFVDEMMQAHVARGSDIHRRPQAHRLETFKNFYVFCSVFAGGLAIFSVLIVGFAQSFFSVIALYGCNSCDLFRCHRTPSDPDTIRGLQDTENSDLVNLSKCLIYLGFITLPSSSILPHPAAKKGEIKTSNQGSLDTT